MDSPALSIQVNDLRKRYSAGWFGKKVDALSGVTFDVPKGQIFGLLGPNGAGKTTIIKVLLGIVRSTGGNATLLGEPAGNRNGRKRVGYLPENLQLPPHQTAQTAMEFYGRLSGMDSHTVKKRGAQLLERVGLAARKKESVKQFSKGMRQRLGLAQALLHNPELLVLDEPTDGLDPVGRSEVRNIIKELGDEGRTVFLNSHLLQEVEMVCDHVAILNHGKLKFVGAISDFAADDTELDVTVVGDEQTVREQLAEHQLRKVHALASGQLKVTIKVKDQAEINTVVDSLRSSGASIVALVPRKRTLEDLFLEVVRGPHQA